MRRRPEVKRGKIKEPERTSPLADRKKVKGVLDRRDGSSQARVLFRIKHLALVLTRR